MIAQKSTNHWSEAIPSCPFVVNSSRNSLQSRIFLIFGLTKIPASTFAAEILVKKFCSGLNASEFLSNAYTNCLIKPKFMCSGGNNILMRSIKGSDLMLLYPTEYSVRFGHIRLW